MSPYEILVEGGGNEHFNHETGQVWLERAIAQWPSNVWINPTKKEHWNYSQSTHIIKEIFSNRMVPLSIKGIEEATKILFEFESGSIKACGKGTCFAPTIFLPLCS